MNRIGMVAAAVLAVGTAPAWAQDDGGFGDFGDFDLNSVLVATFEADQSFLEPEAERVRKLVETALSDAYVVVKMSEVPPFTDYSADIYLRSCPEGQYIGCVFVVAGRAETDWTIGGRVGAVEGGYQVDLSFIDVDTAKLQLEFTVVLDGSNDVSFKEGVVKVMDALVAGEVQNLDLRGDPEAQRAAEAEAAQREAAAKSFTADQIYEEVDDFERGDVGLDAYVGDDDFLDDDDDRITADELSQMEASGGLTPWDRAGLTKAQYKLYRNSGKKLRDFKIKMQGRKGQILLRAGFKVSQGPWGQAHHTGFLLDADTPLENQTAPAPEDQLQQTALQLLTTELVFGGEFEFGYGVLPWMDLAVRFGVHSSPYAWSFQGERAPDAQNAGDYQGPAFDDPEERLAVAWYVGGAIGFAPMPAYVARPTIQVGAAYWQGTAISRITSPIPNTSFAAAGMPASSMILLQASPGVEIDVAKSVSLYARVDIDVPVAGAFFQSSTFFQLPRYYRESEFLQFHPGGGMFQSVSATDVNGNPINIVRPKLGAVGIGGSLGILLRFRVAGDR